MDKTEQNTGEIWKAISELTTGLELIKKDIHWIKQIVQWIAIGIVAVLGAQIPGWL